MSSTVPWIPGARRRGLSGDLRQHNLSQILRYVRDHGTSSRHDIAIGCELGISTMTDLINELKTRRLVRELAPLRGVRAGRPTRPIDFDGEPWCVLGVQVGADLIRFGLTTLGGQDLSRAEVRVPLADAGDRSLTLLLGAIRDQLIKVPPRTDLVAVEVGVPGYLAADGRAAGPATARGWSEVEVREAIGRVLGRAGVGGAYVGVANDTQLAALHAARVEAELGPGASVVAYVGGAREVGSGLIVGGEIFGGAYGGAGALAHFSVDPHGPACAHGRPGCLQSYLGLSRLLVTSGLAPADAAAALVERDPDAAVGQLLASVGGTTTRRALDDAGAALGRGLDAVIALTNPHAVLLGGYLGALGEQLLPAVRRELGERLSAAVFAQTTILALPPSPWRVVDGAVLAARDACFGDPLTLTRPVA